jgi:hypothetical protein
VTGAQEINTPMRKALAIVGGVVALLGAVWTLQGLSVIGGSRMTGDPFWVGAGDRR